MRLVIANSALRASLAIYHLISNAILGDPGAVSGGGKKSKQARKKFGRRKVKNDEKSPWGQGLNGPVPNGRGSSGFWLVPQKLLFFCAQSQSSKTSSRFAYSYTIHCSPYVYSRRKVPITAQNVGEIARHIRKKLAANTLDLLQVSQP